MNAPVSIAVSAVLAIAAMPAFSAGGYQSRARPHQGAPAPVPLHGSQPVPLHGSQPVPLHGQPVQRYGQPVPQGVSPAATNPGMPSFYQPSYSIDRKEWWQPHPYFPPNAQSPGYPSHHGGRPYAGYWREQR